MKLFNKLIGICLMALFAFSILPATLAAWGGTTYPYASYWQTGQTRIGAYTSTWDWNQGLYDYVSPPIATYRYGAQYNYGFNIRDPQYLQYPSRITNIYKPYYGYPYNGYGNSYWTHLRYNGPSGINYGKSH